MFGNGRIKDIIITPLPREQQGEGFMGMPVVRKYTYDRLMVWTDHGYKEQFEKIPGVFQVAEDQPEPRYMIYIDPRYDTAFVMQELEAVVKLKKPKTIRRKKKANTENQEGGLLTFRLSTRDNTDGDEQ